MSRSAIIIAFPTGDFTIQDKAELARWALVSDMYGWRAGTEGGPLIDTASDGKEHVRISLRAVTDDSVYFISREWGGWAVLDRRGHAVSWSSLRHALESICPTLWHGAQPTAIAPTHLPA